MRPFTGSSITWYSPSNMTTRTAGGHERARNSIIASVTTTCAQPAKPMIEDHGIIVADSAMSG